MRGSEPPSHLSSFHKSNKAGSGGKITAEKAIRTIIALRKSNEKGPEHLSNNCHQTSALPPPFRTFRFQGEPPHYIISYDDQCGLFPNEKINYVTKWIRMRPRDRAPIHRNGCLGSCFHIVLYVHRRLPPCAFYADAAKKMARSAFLLFAHHERKQEAWMLASFLNFQFFAAASRASLGKRKKERKKKKKLTLGDILP